jgi:hypothetical protein
MGILGLSAGYAGSTLNGVATNPHTTKACTYDQLGRLTDQQIWMKNWPTNPANELDNRLLHPSLPGSRPKNTSPANRKHTLIAKAI